MILKVIITKMYLLIKKLKRQIMRLGQIKQVKNKKPPHDYVKRRAKNNKTGQFIYSIKSFPVKITSSA